MRDTASARGDDGSAGWGEATLVGTPACERSQTMPHHDPTHGGREESSRLDDRYAGFDTEVGYVLYDTENETAWIQSDAAVELANRA